MTELPEHPNCRNVCITCGESIDAGNYCSGCAPRPGRTYPDSCVPHAEAVLLRIQRALYEQRLACRQQVLHQGAHSVVERKVGPWNHIEMARLVMKAHLN